MIKRWRYRVAMRHLTALNLLAAMIFALNAAAPAPAAAQTQPTTSSAADSLRVTTFNIRLLTDKDGPNQWHLRRELFFQTLLATNPDLIGLQEVVHAQG